MHERHQEEAILMTTHFTTYALFSKSFHGNDLSIVSLKYGSMDLPLWIHFSTCTPDYDYIDQYGES